MTNISGLMPLAEPSARTSVHTGIGVDRPGATAEPLSSAQAARFAEQGFLALDSACNAAELTQLRILLMRLYDRRAGFDEGNQFDMLGADRDGLAALQPQIVKPSLYEPRLLQLPHFRRMQAIARQLLGADAQFCFDHSILKLARSDAATPWHQDEAHHRDPQHQFDQISFWMPLQDVDCANGCMRYLPGSQVGALLPHRPLGGDARVHALECLADSFDASAAQEMPVRAGTCILHAGRTVHGALPNHSRDDRLAYVLVFRSAPRPRTDPMHFIWLEDPRTADTRRNRRWRRHGGYGVLLLRGLRGAVTADGRRASLRWQRLVHSLTGFIRLR